MPQPYNIVIAGAGIAGTVFASCLLRAHPDAKITIIEKSSSVPLSGASVDIRPPAIDIVKWMGVEPQLKEKCTQEEGTAFVRADGRTIAAFRSSGRSDVQAMTSEYEIFRGDMIKIFLKPIQDRVHIIFDETVVSYEQDTYGVIVKFANRPEARYDLLVAADGLGSKIRGMMLGTSPRAQIRDEGAHVAYFTVKGDLLKGSRMAQWRNLPGGRCIFLRPDPHPEGRTRAMLMNITWESDVKMRQKLNDTLAQGETAYRALLEEQFADGDWLTPQILQGMRESDDFYCSFFAQVRSPKLYDGRVVLMGDAAYATPGFGTSLAITGGYVLAGELLKHPSDMGTALMNYETSLKAIVKPNQSDDIAMQLLNPQSSWGIAIRDVVIKTITTLRLDRAAMYAAARFGSGTQLSAMSDYPWPAQVASCSGMQDEVCLP